MIQIAGSISENHKSIVKKAFQSFGLTFSFPSVPEISQGDIISLDKEASQDLEARGVKYYNWDLLFSVLGPNDSEGEIEKKLHERIKIYQAIKSLKSRPVSQEFHGSIRVKDLALSTQFYTWLFGVDPKEWTHRYVTFHRKDTVMNFVLLVSDGKELHHDTLYHLGMGVQSKDTVVGFYRSAIENSFHIEKPPRTTWRGTPLHELWLKDPDGTLIEIYARLTPEELKEMPADKEPVELT